MKNLPISIEMLNIMIAIIAVVALMALGFAIFTISKRMANSSQNDLVNQLDGISNSVFTDLDQQIITGARLKGVVSQVTTADCAVLVGTLSLFGNEVSLGTSVGSTGTKAEATLNGNLAMDMKDGFAPMCQLNDYSVKTSLSTVLETPYLVNYGSILKNSITAEPSGETIVSTVKTDSGNMKIASPTTKYDAGPVEYNQAIGFKDGQFTTKLEFATNPTNSRILRYDNTADFTNKGKNLAVYDETYTSRS